MTKKLNPTIVKCPTCETDVEWSSVSEFRPFCCERCKLIDLGAWAEEEYSVASEPVSPLDDLSNPDFNS